MAMKNQADLPPSPPPPPLGGSPSQGDGLRRNKRHRALRLAGFLLAGLFVLLVLCVAGGLAALRNEGVQNWLTGKVNAALYAPEAGAEGSAPALRARVTSLSGPLPFGMTLGLEVYDGKGLWLRIPSVVLEWDWRALPGALHVNLLRIANVEMLRLPELPESAPPVSSDPFTENSLRLQLGDMARMLGNLPAWLPELRLDRLSITDASVPPEVFDLSSEKTAGGGKRAAPAFLNAEMTLSGGKTGATSAVSVTLLPSEGKRLFFAEAAGEALELKLNAEFAPLREKDLAEVKASASLSATLRATGGDEGAVGGRTLESDAEGVPVGILPSLLRQGAHFGLQLEGGVTAPAEGGPATAARVAVSALNLTAGPLEATGNAQWSSGDARASWLVGALDAGVAIALTPSAGSVWPPDSSGMAGAPGSLETLGVAAPARLGLRVRGPLEAPDVRMSFDCADLRQGARRFSGVLASLETGSLKWRALLQAASGIQDTAGGDTAGSPESSLHLWASATLDQHPLKLEATFFAGSGTSSGKPGLNIGMRDFVCDLPGVTGRGQLAARLPVPLGLAGMPVIEGQVDVNAGNLKAFSSLLPGTRLDGEASASLKLASVQQGAEGASSSEKGQKPPDLQQQSAAVRVRVPRLTYGAPGAAPVELRGLDGGAEFTDGFGKGLLAARLGITELRQGNVRMGAKLQVQGSIRGPLNASLETTGFVAAHGAFRWQPGLVELQRLDVRIPQQQLGFRAAAGAQIRYGSASDSENSDSGGLDVRGLDLAVTPSGRLRAQAVLNSKKLDVRLDLEKTSLTPWRRLVPGMPEGAVAARVRLAGAPSRPEGDMLVSVSDLRLPGVAVKPMSLTLSGKVERQDAGRGGLAARVVLDPATVRALGGSECRIEARVPLLFKDDGLPLPDMQGPLRGTVRWNGAVGPLWELLPLADQRLAGRLALSVDLGGTPEAPSANGFVQLDNARYENLLLGVLLSGINLRLDLEEGRGGGPGGARLRLTAADGLGGTASVAGQCALNGSHLDFKAALDHLRPLRRRDVRIDLSGHASVTGSAAAPQINGLITVNQGAVLLNNLDVGASITTLPISNTPPAWAEASATGGDSAPRSAPSGIPAKNKTGAGKTAGQQSARHAVGSSEESADLAGSQASGQPGGGSGQLDLRIVIPGRFVVDGYGLKSEWKSDIHVQGALASPLVSGQLNAVRGSLDILGKNFKLARGAITFGGGDVGNPLLDIMLSNQTPALTANITITGTVRKMQLVLSSSPEMPREEILAQILFGKSAGELGRLENLRLAAAVAQLAGFGTGSGGGGILDATRKALGADVLRFNSASTGGNAQGQGEASMAAGSSLEMGKYLTEDIYVGVQQGAQQGSTAFVIQLELTPRANLELRSEQQNTRGGLTWKYIY